MAKEKERRGERKVDQGSEVETERLDSWDATRQEGITR
jgi:hypothetical protein